MTICLTLSAAHMVISPKHMDNYSEFSTFVRQDMQFFRVHIVVQRANRYIVAFHIAISYNTNGEGRGCGQ